METNTFDALTRQCVAEGLPVDPEAPFTAQRFAIRQNALQQRLIEQKPLARLMASTTRVELIPDDDPVWFQGQIHGFVPDSNLGRIKLGIL